MKTKQKRFRTNKTKWTNKKKKEMKRQKTYKRKMRRERKKTKDMKRQKTYKRKMRRGRKKKTKKQSGGVKIKNRNLLTTGSPLEYTLDYQAHLPKEGIRIEDKHGVSIIKYEEYAMQDELDEDRLHKPGTFMHLMEKGPNLTYPCDTKHGCIKGDFVILKKRGSDDYIMRCLFVSDLFNTGLNGRLPLPEKIVIKSKCISQEDYDDDDDSYPGVGDPYVYVRTDETGPGETLGHSSLLDKLDYDLYYNYLMGSKEDYLSGSKYRREDIVTMAGEIYFKPEIGIVKWNNLSGHFLPNKKDVEYVKQLDTNLDGWSKGKFAGKYDKSITYEAETAEPEKREDKRPPEPEDDDDELGDRI